ncbi:MAG: 4Fe-4S dicluster domain-containing protein [Desulfomonilaceae bacterium]
MAHHLEKMPYIGLADRLNRFPQGAPPSELLYRILAMLFSEREAELVAQLPIKPFDAEKASKIWKMSLVSARKVLEELADRAILLDIEQNGQMLYCLPPPMAGFFEFSMMRLRNDVNQKVLGELFYQYINVEEDFIRALMVDYETQVGRIFVQEPALGNHNAIHVLDYERASEVVRTASHIGVSMCYCRHKMTHLDRACGAPLDICMTFNTTAASLIRHGYARNVSSSECLELLNEAYSNNLVQFGENVREKVNFICNCCGCCCEALLAIQKFGLVRPIRSNFIARITEDKCAACGNCSSVCPVHAISLSNTDLMASESKTTAKIDEKMCLGCGVCVNNCPTGAIALESRPERIITPVDSVHRAVMMAIERGSLQHLIFDNKSLFSHRAMAAIFGVILKLPPIKRAMASHQLKSRYLGALLQKLKY